MKAVHFGAGNIGRGFIGQMLWRSDYEVVFIDVNDQLVSELSERREYPVVIAGTKPQEEWVQGVTAVHGTQTDIVAQHIADAQLVTTAIGLSALPHIAQVLAAGLQRRMKLRPQAEPLHVIACENAIGGSEQLCQLVKQYLTPEEQAQLDKCVAFPNAAVDRIVPIQQHEDALKVLVEPFFEWVVDRSVMLGEPPVIEGVQYVDSLQPYISRKLFTVNTGHASASYHGYLHGCRTIRDVMLDQELHSKVYQTLVETGLILCSLYDFDPQEHHAYILKILERFANPFLVDDVVRVGRSPIRKLSPQDRLIKPLMLGHSLGLRIDNLIDTVIAALQFDVQEDPEAMELQQALIELGIGKVIEHYMDIDSKHPVHARLMDVYEGRTV